MLDLFAVLPEEFLPQINLNRIATKNRGGTPGRGPRRAGERSELRTEKIVAKRKGQGKRITGMLYVTDRDRFSVIAGSSF
jgi:hypothetical protein